MEISPHIRTQFHFSSFSKVQLTVPNRVNLRLSFEMFILQKSTKYVITHKLAVTHSTVAGSLHYYYCVGRSCISGAELICSVSQCYVIHLFSTACEYWCVAWEHVKNVNWVSHARHLFTWGEISSHFNPVTPLLECGPYRDVDTVSTEKGVSL